MPSIQIVVTCSDRKTSQVPHRLRLRSLPRRGDRPALWIDRLEKEPAPALTAIDLYAGEHWFAVRQLMQIAAKNGFSPDLWICSAGYGLVRAKTPLKPYAATFTKGHSDSIARIEDPGNMSARWWSHLASWKGPANGDERSLASLAASRPRTTLLMVASPSYMRAIDSDLLEAGRILQDRLFVISAGTKMRGALRDFLVPIDARFQHRVGGSRISLNARVATFLLEQCRGRIDREQVISKIDRVSRRLPDIPVYQRTPLTDDRAITLIRRAITADGTISATSALQTLRREGWACEQKRFGRLFHAVKEGSIGS